MTEPLQLVRDWATALELEVDNLSADTVLVTLPGTKRLQVPVAITKTPQALVVESFVARGTDEDAGQLHDFLLRRNAKAFGAAYCIDGYGDVYLVGRIALDGVTAQAIDLTLASVLGMADGDFNTILELGFREAITREWAWRLARGESTANLAAFEQLRPAE